MQYIQNINFNPDIVFEKRDCKYFAQAIVYKHYAKGEYVYHKADTCDQLYILIKG